MAKKMHSNNAHDVIMMSDVVLLLHSDALGNQPKQQTLIAAIMFLKASHREYA